MKRMLTLSLTLLLLLSAIPAVSAEQIVAAEEDIILLAGSDFQVGNQTSQIENIFDMLAIHGLTRADGAFFVGDYTAEARESNTSAKGIEVLKELYRPLVGDNMIFTQGNHDPADTAGLAKDGNNDPASGKYGVFVINENQRMEYNDDTCYEDTLEAANALKAYLDDKVAEGFTKPIFVLNHIGLHWGNRTIRQGAAYHGYLLVDVLNEAGAKGLNIIYLYGHNHSSGYDDWLGGSAVYFKKGDKIPVAMGSKKKEDAKEYTLNFTYMNAGYIGYYSTTDTTVDATVTMSVFLIRGDEVIITRYDSEINFIKNKFGVHPMKSPGVWHADYSKPDYHATPNTLEYAASRKVTATDDVEVEPPRYSPVAEDEPTETTTAAAPTTATRSPTTTTQAVTVTATASTAVVTTAVTTPSTVPPVTDPSQTTTEQTIEHGCVMPEDGGEDTAANADEPAFPLIPVLGICGGAVLVIGGIVIWILLKRKK